MDYLEDIIRDDKTLKVYTCFKCNTFKIRLGGD